MKDETILKLAKLGGGIFLAVLYAMTGMNGLIIVLAAFLLGLPLDQIVTKKLDR